MKPDQLVLKQFNLQGKAELLTGGEDRTYKVEDVILKHINKDSKEGTNWVADLFFNMEEDGFRVAKPIKNIEGTWITRDGWTAWEFLEGNHEYKEHIKQSIEAITLFHKAMENTAKPDFLGEEDSPYIRADKYTWGQKPENIHSDLKGLVESLYEVRKPVEGLENQIIHGDLNPKNILVSETLPPAIIDIAAYFRPPEFALSIYAYWIACYSGEESLLKYFEGIKEFDQMLVRAGIRMLLIMSEFNQIHEIEKYKRATEIILERCNTHQGLGISDLKNENYIEPLF